MFDSYLLSVSEEFLIESESEIVVLSEESDDVYFELSTEGVDLNNMEADMEATVSVEDEDNLIEDTETETFTEEAEESSPDIYSAYDACPYDR